jgi:hypothetical protein
MNVADCHTHCSLCDDTGIINRADDITPCMCEKGRCYDSMFARARSQASVESAPAPSFTARLATS